MIRQTTLATSTRPVAGLQLDREANSTVRFHPAPEDSGVVFIRRDLPGEPRIECCVEHVVPQVRWSALEKDGVVVHCTEHILAALAGCGIDNVEIEIDTAYTPLVTGGSCLGFLRALSAAGVAEQSAPRKVLRLVRPIYHEAALDIPDGADASQTSARRYVVGVPAETFAASYVFHVPAVRDIRIGLAEFEQGRDQFEPGIGSARTYFLDVETATVSKLFCSVKRDFIVLHSGSAQSDIDEVAQHKLLDLWGDLCLLGKPIWGRFTSFRSGHRFHRDLLRRLVEENYLEITELTGAYAIRC